MSTCLAKLKGLPLSFDSAATKASMFASMPSDSFLRMVARCSTPIPDQIGKAASAAATATSTSAALESGIKEYTFPVAGSKLSI